MSEQEDDAFQLSKEKSISFSKMRCKDYYRLLLEENNSGWPTAVKTWAKINDDIAKNWEKSMNNVYKTTSDNKLRQFSFKLLHRILVTKKELRRYGITNDDSCFECQESESIEHIVLECSSSRKLYNEILKWFNLEHNTNQPYFGTNNVKHLPSTFRVTPSFK